MITTKWEDARTGLRVEYVEISSAALRSPRTALWPRPVAGAQFKVTRPNASGQPWVQGYARTEAELAELGVPPKIIIRIRAAAGRQ